MGSTIDKVRELSNKIDKYEKLLLCFENTSHYFIPSDMVEVLKTLDDISSLALPTKAFMKTLVSEKLDLYKTELNGYLSK